MKKSQDTSSAHQGIPSTHVKAQKDRHLRPENKDSLDSRKNEEQEMKAGDVTHNKKENKSKKSSPESN